MSLSLLLTLVACGPEDVSSLPPQQDVHFTMGSLTIDSVSTGARFTAPSDSECSAAANVGLYNTSGVWFPLLAFSALEVGAGSESTSESIRWSSVDSEETDGTEYTHAWTGVIRIAAWSDSTATLTLDGTTCERGGGCVAEEGEVTVDGALDDRGERDATLQGAWTDESSGELLCSIGQG